MSFLILSGRKALEKAKSWRKSRKLAPACGQIELQKQENQELPIQEAIDPNLVNKSPNHQKSRAQLNNARINPEHINYTIAIAIFMGLILVLIPYIIISQKNFQTLTAFQYYILYQMEHITAGIIVPLLAISTKRNFLSFLRENLIDQ